MKNASLELRSHKTCSRATALLAFAICLSSTTHSVFAQSTNPPTTDPPSPTEPVHDIIPVHLDAVTGDIRVGRTTYHGGNPGLHLLALQRLPDSSKSGSPDIPILINEQVVSDPASANQFMQAILSNRATSDAILIANGVGSYGIQLSDIAKNLEQFGAQVDLEQLGGPIPFIFIGNGGRSKGGALQRGLSTLPVDGYLATDQHSRFTFVQTDFVQYDIGLDGTIKVGTATYDVASSFQPGCGSNTSNSFHLLVLNRESLQPTNVNNTYCTAQADSEIGRLYTDISNVVGNNEGLLVFLASNGNPIPSNWNFGSDGDYRIYPLAQRIANLGGYWETVAYLTPADTYSFVGAAAPPSYVPRARDRAAEASSVYPLTNGGRTPLTGELHGVLARGRGNWYSPQSSDMTGVANLQLYTILAMPPSSFPSYTGDQLTAFKYINNKLCGSDNCVRDAYSNLGIDLTSGYQVTLATLVDPTTQVSCDLDANAGLPFCTVRAQLLDELRKVGQVINLYKNVDSLWTKNGINTINSALSAYQQVKDSIPSASSNAQSPSLVRPLVNFFLGLADNIPVIGPAFGIADTAFNLGMDLTTDSNGNKMIDLSSTIGMLEGQAAENFIDQETTTGTMFQILLEDYAKIDTLGTALLNQGNGSQWAWPPDLTGQLLKQMQTAVKQAAYQNVMAAAYAIGRYNPQSSINCFGNGPNPIWGQFPLFQQPRSYVVLDGSYTCGNAGNTPAVTPFQPTDLPWYIPYTYPTDSNNPFTNNPSTGTILADNSWLAISLQSSPSNSGPGAHYDAPNAPFLAYLFTSMPDGLGVYRPAFFEGWPFPRVTCDPSYGVRNADNTGIYVGGCNWNSATAPLQSSPGPSGTDLGIHAYQMGTNQTQVQVLLIISNSGTLRANSVQFSSITLHTLGGSGEATIVSPTLPLGVVGLAAGDSTNLILTLDIPPGITKLGITEEGSMDTGGPQLSQFSEGQVLYPQR